MLRRMNLFETVRTLGRVLDAEQFNDIGRSGA
jgi:hypothetical protein